MQIINYENIEKDFFKKIEFEAISSVEEIAKEVKIQGDFAIKKYSKQFDGQDLEAFLISDSEIKNAYSKIDKKTLKAIKKSIQNVEKFSKEQLKCLKSLKTEIDKNELGHKIIPIESVGCYIPGGNYPLLSSAVMTIVPARVAGVKEIVACSPKIRPETIVACDLAGANKIYNVGGVQAIVGMAYGTQSITKVNKIVGPGNKYVTAAKKYVFGEVGIDFFAGPSEVMAIADESANPEFISADMLAQCEHDIDARAFLVCLSGNFAQKVKISAQKQLEKLSTKEIASKSFEKSFAIVVKSLDEAIELANDKAPEHLELCFKDAIKYIDKFKNYGSLFIGDYSAEVYGDYCSGTNHVLPTNEVSKYSGGLSVFDFVKIQTYQIISKQGNKIISEVASQLADTEGLKAHKLAADIRKFT
ncbi:MAG: histidinol dehydrogenase [Candidatus Gastranaerophilales bacterium]|nr:histidinol dehydrogenase [Candidatus Gastranaerophilales bacterium]